MYFTRLRLLLALLLLQLSASAHAAVPISDLGQPVSIVGQWKFQIGDNPAWAAPDMDDSGWAETAVPAYAPAGHTDYSGMFWYRHTLQLDLSQPTVSQTLGALAITMGNVSSAYEIYAGGIRIGAVGSLPPEPVSLYDKRQTFAIPASAVSESGSLVLALRIWRNPDIGRGETGLSDGEVLLGNVGELRERMLQKALFPGAFLAAIYLVVGLYHLLIARGNPLLKEFFWFGVFSANLAIYTFETSQSKFFLDIPFGLHKTIEYLALYLSPLLFGQTLLAVTRTTSNLFIKVFNGIFLLLALVIVLIPDEGVRRATLVPFQYLGAIWALSMASIMAWRSYKGSRSARVVVAMFLLVAAATINDVILVSPLLGSGNSLPIVFGLLLFSIALMMAERYTEILKNLEHSVELRTSELTDSNRELAVAVETRGNFLANMSHEMRTPMNAILGLTHLGLKTELSEQQRDYFGKVEQSAEGLQGIIDSILDFSKLQDGTLECVREPFAPKPLVETVAELWGASVAQAELEFEISVDPMMPSFLEGDGKRLQQVLGIFISNAVKFTEKGQVGLSLTVLKQDQQVATLRFAVADTGPGIAEDKREQLFTAFSQGDNTMTREHGGAGLGLSIAQRLIELMGGKIEVDSKLEVGSTFSFDLTLPIAAQDFGSLHSAGEIDLSPIRGARVLLVDDSELNLQVAGELLRQASLYVDTAMDGRKAVEKVNSSPYDCVLMDVQMPVMDGYTATGHIRSKPHFKNLPVLAMTANAMPQDRARGAEAGMNAYIPKPIDPDELYRTLLQWIEPGERSYESSLVVDDKADNLQEALPEALPGINIGEGLTRVGGNTALYLSLLKDLCRDYADADQRIGRMIERDDLDDARQLAHKLRGIANNLGLNDVGAAAEAIELPIKSNQSVPAYALPTLVTALAQALESQAELALLETSDEAVTELDEAQRRTIFSQLATAIADFNPEALELVERLLAGIPEDTAEAGELASVRDALDMYDFAQAGEHLQSAAQTAGFQT
ncbi:MAG: response regulator [Halioglobus sp.]